MTGSSRVVLSVPRLVLRRVVPPLLPHARISCLPTVFSIRGVASERRDFVFNDFRTKNGANEGQDVALTGVSVPSSLDSGGVHGGVIYPHYLESL